MLKIPIQGEYIELIKLLKVAGLCAVPPAAHVPVIDAPVRLDEFLSACLVRRRYFLSENGGSSLKLLRSEGGDPPAEAAVLVGPEGGWSGNEETTIRKAGFEPVSLGRTILRAETAVCRSDRLRPRMELVKDVSPGSENRKI